MREIELTQGKVTTVDDEDFDYLSQYKWFAHRLGKTWYAIRNGCAPDGKRIRVAMHRLIADAPSDMVVDHIDRNGLNNTRENLRVCSRRQNVCNSLVRSDNLSGYKGVIWHKASQSWRVQVGRNDDRRNFGPFETAEDAARKYDTVAVEIFGEFAVTNFAQHEENEAQPK